MTSSDDEGETLPDLVSDYYFCSAENELLSFSELPVYWSENEESSDGNKGPIFLWGTADNGLQKLYKQVKACKYDFSKEKPEISVLMKDNEWIKLQKPKKSFEDVIRTILITVHCLHFCKRKPETMGKALWDHLSKVFSFYDARPSENDLIEHTNFISEAVKRDETLAKSKFLATFLKEKPRKRKVFDENAETTMKPSFIVEDTIDESENDDFTGKEMEDSESDDEGDVFDSVCAICDNGGELTCCEGKCLRSFHATVESGEMADSDCVSLGLPPEEVEGSQPFFCANCRYNQHQCFICGELGSSDKSSVAEVFCCSSATCGYFYHPQCVAKMVHQDNEAEAQNFEKKIAAGEPFTCPAHKCFKCKQAENEKEEDLQFAICRRCPRSYHRKCLPRKIVFYTEDKNDEVIPRAWDDLLPKSRALIYCLKHKIDEELGTPARNIKFPHSRDSKKQPSGLLSSKKKVAVKEKDVDSEETPVKRSVTKSEKSVAKSSAVKLVDSSKKRIASSSTSEPPKKQKVADASKKPLQRTLSTKVNRRSSDDSRQSLGSRLFDHMTGVLESNSSKKGCTSVDEDEDIQTTKPAGPDNSSLPPIDDDSKQRILALMKEAASTISLDEVKKYHKEKVPSTHQTSSRVDKSIILARVEGSVEAVYLALKKLEEGCSIEDAMAVCEPRVLDQIMRWKDKLRIYLAPFLHGMRYTSFGRHFTKVEKLEKIVDRLRWYVEDGDTIVDFCCGANDFSCLLKKRLDEMGKKCSYKNYDITRPKNDFNFEKRDWMTVSPKELPNGSKLIMGLNPPFGFHASLANQFIDKALRFKPKLVILIVPPETRRLDHEQKRSPYDLVWEDDRLLAGMSFYLPGSVDVNDKQMDQWNNTPPPLYLWSRSDWTSKHKAIAQKQGHLPGAQEVPLSNENLQAMDVPTVDHDQKGDKVLMSQDKVPFLNKDTEKAVASVGRKRKQSSEDDNGGNGKKRSNEKSKKSRGKFGQTGTIEQSNKRSNENPKFGQTGSIEESNKRSNENPNKNRGNDLISTRKKHSPSLPRESRAAETAQIDPYIERDAGQLVDQTPYDPYTRFDSTYSRTHVDDAESMYVTEVGKRSNDNNVTRPLERRSPSLHRQSRASGSRTPQIDSDMGTDMGQPFDQTMYDPYSDYDAMHSRTHVDDMESRYMHPTREPYLGAPYGRPDGGASDYRIRAPDTVQFPGYESYNRGSYIDEMAKYRIDSSLSQRGGYVGGHREPGFSTGYGSAEPSSYNRVSTSAMQRYAPRLDELNHTRMGNTVPEPPLGSRGMGGYDLAGPGPGPGLGSEPGYRMQPSGFAPGPYSSYSQQNSSGGWLNE